VNTVLPGERATLVN